RSAREKHSLTETLMRDPSTARVVVDGIAIDAEERRDFVGGHDLRRWLRELVWRLLGSAEKKLLVDIEPASQHAERDDAGCLVDRGIDRRWCFVVRVGGLVRRECR